MGKVIGTIAKVVGIAALVVTGVGAAVGLSVGATLGAAISGGLASTIGGISMSTFLIGAAGLSALATALGPKPVAPSAAATDRLKATLNPREYRKIWFGHTAGNTDVRYQEFTGAHQEYLNSIIVVASHAVQSIDEIWFDDALAWSATGGVAAKYAGYLEVTTRTEGTAANAFTITGSTSWVAAQSRLVGCAYVWLRYKLTGNSKNAESPFSSNVPSRVTIRGRGAKLYDPRQDSTVGGSGPQRANDQSTWAWTSDDVGRNPALQLLWYFLGWRITHAQTGVKRLAVGLGLPVARLLIPAFIAAANLCDEPVLRAIGGTEPRYRADGVFSEGDDPDTVIGNLKAAMNGEVRDAGGQLALDILHNDLGTDVIDLGPGDVVGAFTWVPAPPIDQIFNVVRGKYVDPSDASLYQMVDYPEVPLAGGSPDGIERASTLDLSMVQSASQAQRLAKAYLQRAQYPGTFSADFLASAWRVQVGRIVRFTFPALGFDAKLFRVVEHGIRFDGTCPMVLREEAAQIYAWDREESGEVVAAPPTSYDPLNDPLVRGIGNPQYSDGTPIDDLKPAEPGATNGATPTQAALLAQLDADTAAALAAINDLDTQATNLALQAAALAADISAQGGDIVTLQTTTASQGSLIASNATAISNVSGNLATLTTTVAALGTTVSTQASAISSLEMQAASLNTTVTAHTASIAANASAIATTNANLASLTTTVSAGAGNLLTSSDFAAGSSAGWYLWDAPGSGAVVDNIGVNLPDANWHPAVENCLTLHQANRVSTDITINWSSDAVACQPGDVFQAYAWVAAHRAEVGLQIIFQDDSGTWTGSAWVGWQTVGTGGRNLSNYTQIGIPAATAPAGTTRAAMVVVKRNTAAGETDSWMWFLRPYLGYARAGQTTFNTYSRANARAVIQTQATALSTASAQIASLTSTVSSQGASISTQATAISTLNSNVATAFARWALQVDANGYTVGIEINNNGSSGAIKFRSDLFEISSPAGGAKVTFIAGVLRFIDSGGVARVEMGIA